MELDRNRVAVGDIIDASILANEITNFMGYQLNIKYDPEMLRPINLATGQPLGKRTSLTDATILINEEFQPLKS